MAGALLAIEDLRVTFHTAHGTIQAVDGVSLSVAPGETVAVVGESGSGKSVTALSVLRLFGRGDRVTTGGAVRFARADGLVDLLHLEEPAMRAIRGGEIAIVFQDPSASLNPVFTIGEQIAEVLRRHRGLGRTAALTESASLLRRVGIAEPEARLRAYPHQLSGGMRQRVLIAIAISLSPALLVADEPTTALDVTIQAQILDLLRALQAETGMAIVLITHDLGVVAEMADEVAVMYAGKVVERGPAAAVFGDAQHPYTLGLFGSIPRLDDESDRLLAIEGTVPPPFNLPPGCRFNPRCAFADARCREVLPPLASVGPNHIAACLRAPVEAIAA